MQPALMRDEFDRDSEAVRQDPRWRAAMARRGITDLAAVEVHPWPAGNPGLAVDRLGRRIARAVATIREDLADNPFTRPVEGVLAIIDRDSHEVLEVIDAEVDGAVADIKNAICVHEEDYGILWEHTDRKSGTTEVRRSAGWW